jgi:hypothetical protein
MRTLSPSIISTVSSWAGRFHQATLVSSSLCPVHRCIGVMLSCNHRVCLRRLSDLASAIDDEGLGYYTWRHARLPRAQKNGAKARQTRSSAQFKCSKAFLFSPSGMHSYMQMEMQCMPKKTYCTRLLDHTAKLVAQR